MGYFEAIESCMEKYVVFKGRACRSEFWYFVLTAVLLQVILALMDSSLAVFVWLGCVLPYWAVSVRRLHDTGNSGWWFLIVLIPLVGAIALLIWFCLPGTKGDNRFGPDPLAANSLSPTGGEGQGEGE